MFTNLFFYHRTVLIDRKKSHGTPLSNILKYRGNINGGGGRMFFFLRGGI